MDCIISVLNYNFVESPHKEFYLIKERKKEKKTKKNRNQIKNNFKNCPLTILNLFSIISSLLIQFQCSNQEII